MSKSELIACFQDTLKISNKEPLRENTIKSQKINKIYREGFVSNKPKKTESSSIIVETCTTFASAKKYSNLGRVAVLNFANPENPGGGVQFGAMAQEECLCRSSNLFPCISDFDVFTDYYAYHRNQKNHFYSDRLIYTKDVKVFKDDSDVPQIMPKEDWFNVDVITCAAPYLAKCGYINTEALLRLFKSRIKNIFEAALDNEIDVIILGAFGCGAFRNPPLVVAEAFRQVICENNYQQGFKQIVFAIKPTGEYCENVSAFSTQFDRYAPDATGRCILLAQDLNRRFNRIPNLGGRIKIRDEKDFLNNWQAKNKYFKKQFSILGDSISTLEGFNPKGYKVFYTSENCNKANIIKMEDTWWDKVISFFGGELLINNSWSGSRVTKLPGNETLFPSGCSDERTGGLHIGSVMPDVIIVFLGTNDWAYGASIGPDTHILSDDDNEYFESAYDNMLKKIKSNYPNAEVWCCTLSETYITNKPTFKFPHEYSGTHIEKYNNIIRRVTQRNRCKIIDLYGFHVPYDSIDGTHPSADGMNTIAFEIIRTIVGTELNRFIDFAGNKHNCEVLNGFRSENEAVVGNSTQIDPETRYQNCSDLINDLNNYTHLPPKNNIFKKVIKRLKGR